MGKDLYNLSKEDEEEIAFILNQKQDNHQITRQLVIKMMDLMSEYSLRNIDVITSVADFAAFCLYKCQSSLDDPKDKDAFEDLFEKSFQTYLGHYEHDDIIQEISKIEKEKLN